MNCCSRVTTPSCSSVGTSVVPRTKCRMSPPSPVLPSPQVTSFPTASRTNLLLPPLSTNVSPPFPFFRPPSSHTHCGLALSLDSLHASFPTLSSNLPFLSSHLTRSPPRFPNDCVVHAGIEFCPRTYFPFVFNPLFPRPP